jgi:hypothetical protein
MWGDKELRAKDVMEDFIGVGSQGDLMDALAVVKTAAWTVEYHTIADTILTNQVLRIEALFNLIDTVLLPGMGAFKGTGRPYEQIGIGPLWRSWMHDRAILGKNRVEAFMSDFMTEIENHYEDVINDPSSGLPADAATTYENVKQLVGVAYGSWTPGF